GVEAAEELSGGAFIDGVPVAAAQLCLPYAVGVALHCEVHAVDLGGHAGLAEGDIFRANGVEGRAEQAHVFHAGAHAEAAGACFAAPAVGRGNNASDGRRACCGAGGGEGGGEQQQAYAHYASLSWPGRSARGPRSSSSWAGAPSLAQPLTSIVPPRPMRI